MELINYNQLFGEDKQKTAELIKEHMHRGIVVCLKKEEGTRKASLSKNAQFASSTKQAIAMFYTESRCMLREERTVRIIDLKITPKNEIMLLVADNQESFLRTFVINTNQIYKTKKIKIIRQK